MDANILPGRNRTCRRTKCLLFGKQFFFDPGQAFFGRGFQVFGFRGRVDVGVKLNMMWMLQSTLL